MGGEYSTCGGEERCIQVFLRGNLKERDHLEDLGMDGRIILRMIFRKWDRVWIELIWFRKGQVAGTCKRGNETLGCIKCGDFLD
jgi:hypothetical protein